MKLKNHQNLANAAPTNGLLEVAMKAVCCELEAHPQSTRRQFKLRRKEVSPQTEESRAIIRTNLKDMYVSWKAQPIEQDYHYMFMQVLPVRYVDAINAVDSPDLPVVALTMGISADGVKHLLDISMISLLNKDEIWQIFADLVTRGLSRKTLMFFVPCYSGFYSALQEFFPKSVKRICCHSLKKHLLLDCDPEDIQHLERDFKSIYQAGSVQASEQQVEQFQQRWQERYPSAIETIIHHRVDLAAYCLLPRRIAKIIASVDICASLYPKLAKRLDVVVGGVSTFMSPESLAGLILLGHYSSPPSWQDEVRGWKPAVLELYMYYSKDKTVLSDQGGANQNLDCGGGGDKSSKDGD